MQRIAFFLLAAAACLAESAEREPVSERLHRQGVAAYTNGDHTRAVHLFESAAAIAAPGPHRARIWNDLGAARYASGFFGNAAADYRRALAEWSAFPAGDADKRDMAAALNNLAVAERRRARLNEAETLARRAMALIESIEAPPVPLARIRQNLAEIARLNHRWAAVNSPVESLAEAEKFARAAWTALAAELGEDHTETEVARTTLAFVLFGRGRASEAEKILRPAAGRGNAAALADLAQIYRAQGRLAEAEPLLRQVLAIQESSPGNAHRVARALKDLADLFAQQGKNSGAEKLYRRALAIAGDTPSRLRGEIAAALLRRLETGNRTTDARRVRSAYLEGVGSNP